MRAGRIRRRTRRQVLAVGLSFQKIHGGRKMKNRRKKTAAAAAALMLAGLMAFPAAAAPQPACIAGARSDRELTAQTMNSTYLLPDSDTYYITEADISWMT